MAPSIVAHAAARFTDAVGVATDHVGRGITARAQRRTASGIELAKRIRSKPAIGTMPPTARTSSTSSSSNPPYIKTGGDSDGLTPGGEAPRHPLLASRWRHGRPQRPIAPCIGEEVRRSLAGSACAVEVGAHQGQVANLKTGGLPAGCRNRPVPCRTFRDRTSRRHTCLPCEKRAGYGNEHLPLENRADTPGSDCRHTAHRASAKGDGHLLYRRRLLKWPATGCPVNGPRPEHDEPAWFSLRQP